MHKHMIRKYGLIVDLENTVGPSDDDSNTVLALQTIAAGYDMKKNMQYERVL